MRYGWQAVLPLFRRAKATRTFVGGASRKSWDEEVMAEIAQNLGKSCSGEWLPTNPVGADVRVTRLCRKEVPPEQSQPTGF